jgi:hypothetical protein
MNQPTDEQRERLKAFLAEKAGTGQSLSPGAAEVIARQLITETAQAQLDGAPVPPT